MGKKLSNKEMKRREKEDEAKKASIKLFEKFYIDQYGSERWGHLFEALKKPSKHVALGNKYAEHDFMKELLGVGRQSEVT